MAAASDDVSLLVSCDWLKAKMDGGSLGDIVIIDVSWSSQKDCREEYRKKHIPGASYLDVMVGPHSEHFPRNIPPPEVFQEAARAAGVHDNSHVILYSDSDNFGFFMSGRAWWTFTVYGAKQVSILNGGLQKWLSLGYPTTDAESNAKPGTFTARFDNNLRLTYEQMQDRVKNNSVIADSRSTQQHKDGHIPGALNLPYSTLMDPDAKEMKPLDDVKQALKSAGIDVTKPVITYCNSGMSSSTLAFTLALCGARDFAVYHGGYTEWKKREQDQ